MRFVDNDDTVGQGGQPQGVEFGWQYGQQGLIYRAHANFGQQGKPAIVGQPSGAGGILRVLPCVTFDRGEALAQPAPSMRQGQRRAPIKHTPQHWAQSAKHCICRGSGRQGKKQPPTLARRNHPMRKDQGGLGLTRACGILDHGERWAIGQRHNRDGRLHGSQSPTHQRLRRELGHIALPDSGLIQSFGNLPLRLRPIIHRRHVWRREGKPVRIRPYPVGLHRQARYKPRQLPRRYLINTVKRHRAEKRGKRGNSQAAVR